MLRENKINSSAAQAILSKMINKGGDPSQIAEQMDLLQISDSSALAEVIEKILEAHPAAAQELKEGKTKTLQFLIGQVMKETKGKANPQVVAEIISEKINGA